MENIYFIFENNKEAKYYYKNVLAEIDNNVKYFGIYYSDDKDLTITKKEFNRKETNILKKIFNKLRNHTYTSTTYYIKDSIKFHFLSERNFSIEEKNSYNTYWFINDGGDYTSYIFDIINGDR